MSILAFNCFDTVGWASTKGIWPVKIQLWGAGVVICLDGSEND